MIRVHVICEGETEEAFVKSIMAPYFANLNISLSPSLLGKPGKKGGNVKLERICLDVSSRLKNDTSSYCTTFFDFYGLNPSFPGFSEAKNLSNKNEKSIAIKNSLTTELKRNHYNCFEHLFRFIPFVQLHEFETLLFSSPEVIANTLYFPQAKSELKRIVESFESVEEINCSNETAPSKRLRKIFPSYEKVVYGELIASHIGLETIAKQCTLFGEWITTLKSIKEIKKIEIW